MSKVKKEKGVESIRVLHLITIFSLGGATENTLLTVEGLHELGYDVGILTGPNISTEGSLFDRAKRSGIRVEVVPELMRSIHPVYDVVAFFKIYAALRKGRYHIVHTHSSKAGLLGRIAAKLARVPVIIHTIHGLPFHDYQGKTINRIFVLAERLGAKVSDRIISVTDTITRKALAAGVGAAEKFVTVRSGFEMDQFVRRPRDPGKLRKDFGLKKTDLIVGKIARFSQLKGHQYLIDIAPEVVRRVPRAKFLFVGSGELESQFKRQVEDSGVRAHVVFAGLVSQERIASLISIMDIVVHTSLLEGLARVLPQAFAAGKPVISYNIDGAHEVVHHGVSGYLVEPRNEKELTELMIDLLKDRKKARRFGQNGKRIIKSDWTKEAMVTGINSIYRKLLSEKHIL